MLQKNSARNSQHFDYMRRCFQLASLGLGEVQPNPMVGAVIVVDNTIISEGWHRKYGFPHAEIEAINSVKEKNLLKKSTLYVNLEPCSNFGKTPPCTDAIIQHQIPKVVIANVDPNEKVNGQGICKLKKVGIFVTTGILEEEGKELNKRFFTYHQQKRPYIILKWAQTADGFMDIDRENNIHKNYWITNPPLRTIVHQWRSEEDAIAVGYNTLQNDKPQLTTRFYIGKNPKRFVITNRNPEIEIDSFTFLPDHLDEMMNILYQQKIQSIIIEGGKKTLERFLSADLWDEARILIGNQYWKSGVKAHTLSIRPQKEIVIENNIIQYVRRHL